MDNTAEGWFEIQPEDIEPAILPIIQREISQFAVELEAVFAFVRQDLDLDGAIVRIVEAVIVSLIGW
jgi:hypothetical protein